MAAQIALFEDGPGSYRFTFGSTRGELSGRVTVGIEGPPDRRSYEDREQAAKNQILALSREFSAACGDRPSFIRAEMADTCLHHHLAVIDVVCPAAH